MVWCASTEIFISPGPAHWTLEAFEKAMDANDQTIAPSMLYAYAAIKEGVPVRQRRAQPDLRLPGHGSARQGARAFPSAARTSRPARPWSRPCSRRCSRRACSAWPAGTPPTSSATATARCWTTPRASRPRRSRKLGVLEYILQPQAVSRAVRRDLPQGADQLLSAPGRQQGGLGQHRHLRVARLPDADQGRFSLPRLDPGRAAGARPGAVLRPGPAGRHERHPGVALLLLQEPADRAGAVSRARPVHPADQAQEHPPLPDGRSSRSPIWASSTTRKPDEIFPPHAPAARRRPRAGHRPSSARGSRRSRSSPGGAASAAPSGR